MIGFLKSLLTGSPRQPSAAVRIPDGERVFAIGDVHGRLDLLEELASAIEAYDAAQGQAESTIILLGDLVDRGPDSAGVVDFARQWQKRRKVRILAGNHEEMFLRSFESSDILRHFLRHGGKETLLSYGVDRKAYNVATVEGVQQLMAQAVSEQEREYLASFEDMIAIGDYLFVHAGIEPGVAIEDQKAADLRWIREPFLSHGEAHPAFVVHGHTITDSPDDTGVRIGIDTGAYSSGRLTALALEGASRLYIEAAQSEDGAITTRQFA